MSIYASTGAGCPTCGQPAAGNSKYCPTHKRAARQEWLDRVRDGAAVKAERDAAFRLLFAAAHAAGLAAGQAAVPVPMVVQQHRDMLDDQSPIRHEWIVPEGVCGFAWVVIKPGNCPAANYGKTNDGFKSHYHGGVAKWISGFGQSYTRKRAYAAAFADVLHQAGINAWADSRLD